MIKNINVVNGSRKPQRKLRNGRLWGSTKNLRFNKKKWFDNFNLFYGSTGKNLLWERRKNAVISGLIHFYYLYLSLDPRSWIQVLFFLRGGKNWHNHGHITSTWLQGLHEDSDLVGYWLNNEISTLVWKLAIFQRHGFSVSYICYNALNSVYQIC